MNAKQPERPALQAGPSRCESGHGRHALKVQSDCTPVCEAGGSWCKSTWERQFSWWPWCNSSIMPCDGIGAGANPVGHPIFPLRGKIVRRRGAAWSFVRSTKDDGPKFVGYRLLLVQVQSPATCWPCASTRRSSMVEQPPQGVIPRQSLAHLLPGRGECRDRSTATVNPEVV